ncbi:MULTISPECIES: NYN domain-containing protein [unclassified Providencia]|uniref:NYN domain-containing protein n=1 Tax=unclassified Providencia TaxID=2633465 RepID=UPI00234BA37F|nr:MULTISPECIES: NYN domain-containing protein [unclassified Providencia]
MKENRLAVLIDADNAQASLIENIFQEIATEGTIYIKRIYGDWTQSTLSSWKKVLNENAITPIQQFAYTTGKNSTDSALIIDAMDLLYTNRFDGFCIVSSDSDFTRLATRIRENGLKVYGYGMAQTPKPFRAACDKFIDLTIFNKNAVTLPVEKTITPQAKTVTKNSVKSKSTKDIAPEPINKPSNINAQLRKLLLAAIENTMEDNGWANLAFVGAYLQKIDSSFDARLYGYKSLSALIKDCDFIDIDETPDEKNKKIIHYQIKAK